MAQLAIKGHLTRGEEVIEILEMLGGKNIHNSWGVFKNRIYTIDEKTDGIIDVSERHYSNYNLFTLEEFFEKFPYKVRDKVIAYYKGILAQFTIQDMRWNYELNKVEYKICSSWLDTSVILPYKEETIDKANKSVFDANAQCCDIMDHLIKEETMEELIPRIDFDKYCKDKYLLDLGNYEIKEENGKTYAVRKQFDYPKTFVKCCEILYPNENFQTVTQPIKGHNGKKLFALQKLLICRDAYWKIAGEHMGLDKPWEPDYNEESYEQGSPIKYVIYYTGTYITKGQKCTPSYILAFPSEEMRDVFFENFKKLIEECKELL